MLTEFAPVITAGLVVTTWCRSLIPCAVIVTPSLHRSQEEPIFHLPFQMLSLIGEVDKLFTQWRYRHAIMVHG
jgi:hypothetical protein